MIGCFNLPFVFQFCQLNQLSIISSIGIFSSSSKRFCLVPGITLRRHVFLVSFYLVHFHSSSLSFMTSFGWIQWEPLLIFKITRTLSSIVPFLEHRMCKSPRVVGDNGVGKELCHFYSTCHPADTMTFIILTAIWKMGILSPIISGKCQTQKSNIYNYEFRLMQWESYSLRK